MSFENLQRLPTEAEIAQAMDDVFRAFGETRAAPRQIARPHTKTSAYLLPDNDLPTGSFKFRSAVAVVASAIRRGDKKLVTASSGNFGMALAAFGHANGVPVGVVVPDSCPQKKVDSILAVGGNIITCDGEFDQSVVTGLELAEMLECRFVSPDNDPYVIAGAASTAAEIAHHFPEETIDVFAPFVGAGSYAGLRMGFDVMTANGYRGEANCIAVTLRTGPSAGETIDQRDIWTPTGTASYFDVFSGDVEPQSPAYELAMQHRRYTYPVARTDVEFAALELFNALHTTVEATAAASYAAAMSIQRPGAVSVGLLSGGNVDSATFAEVLESAAMQASGGAEPIWHTLDRLSAQRSPSPVALREDRGL